MPDNKITDIINSCQQVEYTLWLEHSDEYNYINAYNLAYLSKLAYSRVILDEKKSLVYSKSNYDFQQFINEAQTPFKLCHMNGKWNSIKMTKIKNNGKDTILGNLTPFIEFIDINKGINYPSNETGYVDDENTSTAALFYSDEKRAVIAVRGTAELDRDLKIDLDAKQISPEVEMANNIPQGIQGQVHQGFYTQFLAIKNSPSFQVFIKRIKGKELFVTGHSLGGAVATILRPTFMN